MEAESFLDFSDVRGGVQNRPAHPERGVVGPLRGGNPPLHPRGNPSKASLIKQLPHRGGNRLTGWADTAAVKRSFTHFFLNCLKFLGQTENLSGF